VILCSVFCSLPFGRGLSVSVQFPLLNPVLGKQFTSSSTRKFSHSFPPRLERGPPGDCSQTVLLLLARHNGGP
jgi:hypothetical protein